MKLDATELATATAYFERSYWLVFAKLGYTEHKECHAPNILPGFCFLDAFHLYLSNAISSFSLTYWSPLIQALRILSFALWLR